MDAIHARAPRVLFFLEGTGQSGIGANWGDGFATDPQLVKAKGLSDTTAFFQVHDKPRTCMLHACGQLGGKGRSNTFCKCLMLNNIARSGPPYIQGK